MKQLEVTKPFPTEGAVSIPEVAEYLGICNVGIYRLLELDPTFPKPKKILRSVKFNAKDIINWFEGGK
jgi:predicted DNA-binding transcriptional regulator AlpA